MGWTVPKMKSPMLKRCMNPECDFYYYGYKHNRYCCPKCAVRATNLKNKEYRKEWIKENKDRINAHLREYHLKHPEKRREYHRNWCNKNKEKQRQYHKQYHKDHKDDINKRQKESYQKKKENNKNNVRNDV